MITSQPISKLKTDLSPLTTDHVKLVKSAPDYKISINLFICLCVWSLKAPTLNNEVLKCFEYVYVFVSFNIIATCQDNVYK